MTDDAPPAPPRPMIDLTLERAFCAMHGEPFREAWPKGFPIAAIELARTIIEGERTWSEAAQLLGIAIDQVEPKHIEPLLDARPACCRVSRDRLREVYVASGVGYVMRCKVCRRFGLGTRYRTVAVEYRHVCFRCVTESFSTRAN